MVNIGVIDITDEEIKEIQGILDIEEDINEKYSEGTYKEYGYEFEDYTYISISVVIGQSNAYIDGVMYDNNGNEISVMEPGNELLGEYIFEDYNNGKTYRVDLK